MTLITAEYVKQNFPEWEYYAEQDPVAETVEDALANQMEQAQDELADYVTVTSDTITRALKRHLLNIVAKNLFMLRHADTEFQREPQVLRDYRATLSMLTELRNGERASTPPTPDTAQEAPMVTAKARRFGPGQWFTDIGNYPVNSKEKR